MQLGLPSQPFTQGQIHACLQSLPIFLERLNDVFINTQVDVTFGAWQRRATSFGFEKFVRRCFTDKL